MPQAKLVEVLQSTEHFWSFTAQQCCSILRNNWSRWGLGFKCKKKQTWNLQQPRDPRMIWTDVIFTRNLFAVLKALACILSEACHPLIQGFKKSPHLLKLFSRILHHEMFYGLRHFTQLSINLRQTGWQIIRFWLNFKNLANLTRH